MHARALESFADEASTSGLDDTGPNEQSLFSEKPVAHAQVVGIEVFDGGAEEVFVFPFQRDFAQRHGQGGNVAVP